MDRLRGSFGEPTLELGSCASSPFESCQARKGAALRRIPASAAGYLGSMVGFFYEVLGS